MSMIEPVETHGGAVGRPGRVGPLCAPRRRLRRSCPRDSIAGRSLAAVVAIMTFLAALTAGAVTLVVSAASDWQLGSRVARSPFRSARSPGRDIEADVRKAVEIVRATAGIADVRGLHQGGIRAAGRALARRRALRSTTCRYRA